jgi:hypothetical protein
MKQLLITAVCILFLSGCPAERCPVVKIEMCPPGIDCRVDDDMPQPVPGEPSLGKL